MSLTTQNNKVSMEDEGRSGPIWLVLILALVIAAAGTLLAFLKTEEATPFILGLLALLAVFGIFALFAAAVGLIELTGGGKRSDLSGTIVDHIPEGTLVTDGTGRIVYANRAYVDLTGADGIHDVRTLERVFARDAEVAEVLYRLTTAARDGRNGAEEVRIRGDGQEAVRWLKIRATQVPGENKATNFLWSVSDITRERQKQENIVQELQNAIDYLDHAPA
ncbi:MAG: PAS domain-containing protein, partial [Pseudomonadota bacterium]